MTSPENRRSPAGDSPDSGGLARKYLGWALFGAFGIGVAVGIALVAGQLASQPVGITGEPVSATSSLASPPDRSAGRSDEANGKTRRDTRERRGQGATSGTGSAAAPGTNGIAPSSSSSSGSGNSGNGGTSGGTGGSRSPAPGGATGSNPGNDYDNGDDYEYEDDSSVDDDDDYGDDD